MCGNPVHRGQQLHAVRGLVAVDQAPHAIHLASQLRVLLLGDEGFRLCQRVFSRFDLSLYNAIAEAAEWRSFSRQVFGSSTK